VIDIGFVEGGLLKLFEYMELALYILLYKYRSWLSFNVLIIRYLIDKLLGLYDIWLC